MICKNCGHELPENINFCSACGSPLHQDPEAVPESAVPEESTVQTESVASEPSEAVFASPDFDSQKPEKNSSSKKKKTLIRSLLVAIPLVIALLVFLNWTALAGFCVKTFGSDADYLRYVESKSIDETAEGISSFFSSLDYDIEQGATTKIDLNISEDLIDLLSEANTDDGITDILRWLNDVSLIADTSVNKNNAAFSLAAESNGSALLSGNLVADFDSQKFYLSFPELTEGVLSFEMPTADAPTSIPEISAIFEKFKEALPSKDVFESLLKKYMSVALDSLDNVSSYEKNIKVDGIEEECTVLRITFDEKSMIKLAKSVLEEAKTDNELKSCLKRILNFAANYDSSIPDIDLDSIYSSGIDALIEELERSSLSSRNEEFFTWCDYVVDHEVVGGAIEFEGEEVFRYITLHDGDNFTFELFIADSFEIHGNGTTKNDILSAKYNISAMMPESTELFYIDVSDFNLAKLKKGNLCGTFKLAPSDTLLDTADSSLKLLNPSFEVISDQSESKQKLTLNVYTHDEILAGISFDSDLRKNPEVNIPKGQRFETDNFEEIISWLKTIKLDGLLKSLDQTDAPDIILDAISELQNSIVALNTPPEEILPPAAGDSPTEAPPASDDSVITLY